MGAPGADRPERPMGPVASVVVARSECPVLTVPAHPAARRNEAGVFSRIVCAVDLAPSSASVIRQALSLAWETKARLTYVCVSRIIVQQPLRRPATICSPRFRPKRINGVRQTSSSQMVRRVSKS